MEDIKKINKLYHKTLSKSVKNNSKILNKKIKRLKTAKIDSKKSYHNFIIKDYDKENRKQNKFTNNNNNKLNSNIIKTSIDKITIPKKIYFLKNLVKDSYTDYDSDNTFDVFLSINNILFLIYSNKKKSIISYNLNDNKKINEFKNAHNMYISILKHYLDNKNKRDLIISVSCDDNNLKLWNINNLECLLNLKNIYNKGILSSACLLNNNNNIYIISSNINSVFFSNPIKVFDLDGNKIKEISDSYDNIAFIDNFYDNKMCKNYIITGNEGYSQSFDFNENKIYHKYFDDDHKFHNSIVINNNGDKTKLIESSEDGNIRIWNFHTCILLNKINIDDELYGLCIWDNECLFVGCYCGHIKMIEFKKEIRIKNLKSHKSKVLTIKKMVHPKYGKCLLSQGYYNDTIKLWVNIN